VTSICSWLSQWKINGWRAIIGRHQGERGGKGDEIERRVESDGSLHAFIGVEVVEKAPLGFGNW
jgi:hypothetical protein